MKYDCNVVRDLMPLLGDGVLSDESKKVIREHLRECPECREYQKNGVKALSLGDDSLLDEPERRDAQYLASFKKKFRRFVLRLVLGVVAGVLLCLLIFLGVIAKLTVFADSYKTTDLSEYRNFTGHIEGEAQELYGSKSRLLIFPEAIPPSSTVNQFYYRCASSGFDNSYQLILDYTLPRDEFEKEVERLSQLKMEYAGQTKRIARDARSFRYPAFVSLFSKFDDYEYALIDEENCRIVCVLCCLYDIDKLPIDDEFLPVTDEAYAGAEGWYGYSMYHFPYSDSDEGGLVIPSPPKAE